MSQLSDLDELKEELSEEEYQELKKETLDQITEFEAFLEKNKDKYAEATKEAKAKLEAEKARVLGIQKMKDMIEGQAAETIRVKIAEIKFNFEKKKTINDNQYHQMMMAQILQLEKCAGASLTQEELSFKSMIQQKGLSNKIQSSEMNENIGNELAQFS